MSKPEEIELAKVFVPLNSKENLLQDLHEKGICQIESADAEDYGEDIKDIELLKRKVSKVHEELDNHKPLLNPESALKSLFSPSKKSKVKSLMSKDNWYEEMKRNTEKIESIIAEKEGILAQKQDMLDKNEGIIETLKMLPAIETSEFEDSDHFHIETGIIPTVALDNIDLSDAVYNTKAIDEKHSFISVVFFKSDKEIIKRLFEFGFIAQDFPKEDKKPWGIRIDLHRENLIIRKEMHEVRRELKNLAIKEEKTFRIYLEELKIYSDKLKAIAGTENSQSFTILNAWVPKKNKTSFEKSLKNYCGEYIAEFEEKEEAPSILDNSKYASPFEMITRLYSVPKYKHFDPTIFIAITFPLFFGLMLTDAVYGLLMAVFAFFLYKGVGQTDEGMKRFSLLLIISGISTVIMGMIFGSYFGNFFQELGFKIPLVFDTMKDIIPMIALVLSIGLIHMTMGLIAGFIENNKHESFKKAMEDQGVWLLFVASLLCFVIMMLLSVNIMKTIGFVLLGSALLLQFVFNLVRDGPVKGVLSLFDFSGFMGDLFSYIRLMAMAIGTSGVALAFNFMAIMAYDMIPYIGIVVAVFVFVVGHLFNLAMNGLGAFIHTLRLHFLEHFSKYYDGGGKEYVPFYANRKLTKFVEVEK